MDKRNVVFSDTTPSEIENKPDFLNLWEDLAVLGLKHVVTSVVLAAAKLGQDGAQQRQ